MAMANMAVVMVMAMAMVTAATATIAIARSARKVDLFAMAAARPEFCAPCRQNPGRLSPQQV